MSFYTSLTGLNAATSQLGVTSNNIANVGTTGFKRSRADFGDIFATSPLQKASSTVGQGVSLKQVSQEFSQGNVSFSANALDLAITGDGFFPLRSADGLQDIYTRNGSFTLNEQFNVVNSAGQRLMAATVDSTGSANVNERVVLTIPQKTSGEAKQTSLVELGLNFPADAQVITAPFNRADTSTYNKSTAMTVYDNGGNGYLATIYYVKTANANQSSPTNKWQTYVFVGDEKVNASLVQASDVGGDPLYVNQYGQIKPFSEVKDELTTAKTQLISLDELTDVRQSVPASVASTETMDAEFDLTNGVDFKTYPTNRELLSKVFTLDVDNSGSPITVDLSYLATRTGKMTGNQIAAEMTNYLNRAFGDESFFDISTSTSREFTLRTSRINTTTNGLTTPTPVSLSLNAADFGLTNATVDWSKITTDKLEAAMQKRINNTPALRTVVSTSTSTITAGTDGTTYDPAADANGHFSAGQITATTKSGTTQTVTVYAATSPVEVKYDYNARTFNFTDGTSTVSIAQGANGRNEVLGLDSNPVVMNEDGSNTLQVLPNGGMIRPLAEQRYGIQVSYDAGTKTFAVKSGTTGDDSGIKLDLVKGTTGASTGLSLGDKLFGFKNSEVLTSNVALRGIASKPAIAYGVTPTTNVTNNFAVDSTNNRFVVTVDGVKGTVVIPTDSAYSVESFANALEKGINSLANNTDGVPQSVNGVKVSYDYAKSRFVFTSGTTSTDSYIKISGSSNWGLEQVEAGRGETATWIKPTQHKELVGGQLVPKYIDGNGVETTNGDGFTVLPAWSPIYLDKGELTFDTGGKLVSPQGGTQLETVYLAGGKGALTINIDYSASTQQTSPFAVLSQSQDGAPEGDLVGVTIGNDGLVSASYSNGSQKSLAKILLTNFSSPTGLRQIGDSSFLASAASGNPILGTAGTAGFGTIRAGATERSNVDLTQELVELITAQRNFQANAKAIETSTTMTQAIINIRG
jgi:flagellar hook-basal body protein